MSLPLLGDVTSPLFRCETEMFAQINAVRSSAGKAPVKGTRSLKVRASTLEKTQLPSLITREQVMYYDFMVDK